jgi:subtilisin-like proprotein convertase family protein
MTLARFRVSPLPNVLAMTVALAPTFSARATSPPMTGCPRTQVTLSKNTPVSITDSTTIESDIIVSGLDPYLWDLDVQTSITHSANGQLTVTLTSPAGTVVTLTSGRGGTADNVFNGTVWDDSANPDGQVPYSSNNGMVTDHAYVDSTLASPLVPEEALGAFLGEDPNGTWRLSITDGAGGDVGSLNSWSLTFATFPAAPNVLVGTGTINDDPVAISDGATLTSTISLSGLPGTICFIQAATNITHTAPGDLQISIRSPSGTIVTLTTNNAGSNDNVFNGTLWKDTAGTTNPPGPVTDTDYFPLVVETPVVAEEAMGAFLGEDPNGTWTLTVADIAASDTGMLHSWEIGLFGCSFLGINGNADSDSDGTGDACDNCPTVSDSTQKNIDGDQFGDVCDNCPSSANNDQADGDNDGRGDVCDKCPTVANSDQADGDGDGKGDVCDNCLSVFNADQADADGDGKGDACDNCSDTFNAEQADTDSDAIGDACEPPPPPPSDSSCGTCAPGVLPAALLNLSLMTWSRRRRGGRMASRSR